MYNNSNVSEPLALDHHGAPLEGVFAVAKPLVPIDATLRIWCSLRVSVVHAIKMGKLATENKLEDNSAHVCNHFDTYTLNHQPPL